jgi:hypothetical protein
MVAGGAMVAGRANAPSVPNRGESVP